MSMQKLCKTKKKRKLLTIRLRALGSRKKICLRCHALHK